MAFVMKMICIQEMVSQNIEVIYEKSDDIWIPISTNAGEEQNLSQTLTKRQLKRRAHKLKRESESKQLEKLDVIQKTKANSHIDNKQMKKQEKRKALESRRKYILERLEWAKANLPMMSPDSQVKLITLDDLKN